VILAFEDLHWIDSQIQAFLETLIDGLASAPLLLILTYRPEYEHHWGGKSYYTQLRLDVLSPETTEEFLRNLVGDDVSLFELKELLPKHGNPLFLEETVRMLVETNLLEGDRGRYRMVRPLQQLRLPPTVQAILAARIDRLPARDKRLLQAASVVGKDVPYAILQPIAGLVDDELRRGLAELREAEFLYEARLFPDVEYTFKHAHTHEVAYGSLLADQRRALHQKIVGVIERLYPDRLTEQVEQLAHHALRGELREKAAHYLRQAGNKAALRSALQDARRWLEQALDLLEALPESRSTLEEAFEIRLELRPVLTMLGEAGLTLGRLQEAGVLAERLNDDRRRGQVFAFMTNVRSYRGELNEALACGGHALEIARALGDLELRILATTFLEQAHYYLGEYERVVELAADNLAVLPADWVYKNLGNQAPASVYDRVWLTLGLVQLGNFTEAETHAVEAIRIAEPTHHAWTVGFAQIAAGMLRVFQGDWASARTALDRGIEVVRTGKVALLLPFLVAPYAWVLAQLGEASEALDGIREVEQLVERQTKGGLVAHSGWYYQLLGRTYLVLCRPDEARRLADRALDCSRAQPGYTAHALHLLGDIVTWHDRFDPEGGQMHYRKALLLAELRGMRPLVAHCHVGLGKLYRQVGKRQEGQEHLKIATTMYREMDMRSWLAKAEADE
jgi:tetratricopeptide (TPR) repeat protein